MRSPFTIQLAAALLLLSPPAFAAGSLPVQLNGHARLGQVFSVPCSLLGVTVMVPSWCDAEGGLTLSLWESPARKTLLAQKTVTGIADNAALDLLSTHPLPAGCYYWEIDQRTGTTPIGLYADLLDADSPEPAYFDDRPDPRKRFVFQIRSSSLRFADLPSMLTALARGSQADREDACRQLSFQGTRECVAPLAGFLRDPELSQFARFALEPMPWPEAGAALRSALPALQGGLAVGVIHSLGARRDAAAVPLLRERLAVPDAAIAAAAADALGKIATGEAVAALLTSLDSARPDVAHALLTAARRHLESGQPPKAQALFDELRRRHDLPPAIGFAALSGALEAQGERAVPWLIEILQSAEPMVQAAALGVVQQRLPGKPITQDLAQALPNLPPAAQRLLIHALGCRGDSAAVPALVKLAGHKESTVREALVQALSALGSPLAAGALAQLVCDPDPAVANAAETALGRLPGTEADAESLVLLRAEQRLSRLAGIRLAGARRLDPARQDLLRAGNAPDADLRLAALRVLKELAQPGDLPTLLNLLATASSAGDREAVAQTAAAACGRAKDPAECAAELLRHMDAAATPARESYLRLLAGLGDPWSRQAVLQAARGEDAGLRTVAFRLLHQWQAPEAAADLLQLARQAPDATGQSLCLRAALRLAGTKGLVPDQALALCREAVPLIRHSEEKKLLLGTLATLASPEALFLADSFGKDPAARDEAAAAVVAIAESLVPGPHAAKVLPPIESLAANPPNAELGRRAQAIVAKARPISQAR